MCHWEEVLRFEGMSRYSYMRMSVSVKWYKYQSRKCEYLHVGMEGCMKD